MTPAIIALKERLAGETDMRQRKAIEQRLRQYEKQAAKANRRQVGNVPIVRKHEYIIKCMHDIEALQRRLKIALEELD